MTVFSVQRLIDCYAHYIQQVGLIHSHDHSGVLDLFQVGLVDRVREVCAHYPALTQRWVNEFYRLFHMEQAEDGHAGRHGDANSVDSDDWLMVQAQADGQDIHVSVADRPVWRTLAYCLRCTVRTNYYVPWAKALVIKIMHPHSGVREIFMDHPEMQGVLLKGAMVARGGLRWSDRSDFRAECWQLMSTQVLKNAMIVPSGSKGAFVRKNQAIQPLDVYRLFVQGVLDISDNLVNGRVVPAAWVRRYDGDDYYNVVAADKGTGTFADEGNAIAVQRGYWLGDAFASGGGTGYNHKKLAITSRGAWVSVRHHLQHLKEDARVLGRPLRMVGVGDMAGDVFGNGLLEDPDVVLLAAFNHEAIFLDPQPDPVSSYAQRRRLFDKPGSRWSDYQGVSLGGGVFARSLVSIELSPQASEMLGLPQGAYTPEAIIRAMLTMPVDVLWLGGIGTYIKGSEEDNVPDKDNELLRVNGRQVRAAIVAEGANLGITAEGRVECALNGVRLNTDSIDNCAGVHCSDREVNLKILLGQAMANGALEPSQRAEIMASMTQDVCTLVLRENGWQNMALSGAQHCAQDQSIAHVLRALKVYTQASGCHDGKVLHDSLMSALSHGRTEMTRPEMSWVLSLAKRALKSTLRHQVGGRSDWNAQEVMEYFPALVQERFRDYVSSHLLRLDIAITACANRWINMTGPVALGLWASQWDVSLNTIVAAWCDVDQDTSGWSLQRQLDDTVMTCQSIHDVLSALMAYRELVQTKLRQAVAPQTVCVHGQSAHSPAMA